MQTTLLGLAIAIILALLAALIGPYFVDWNQFRPQFEAEASRVLGAPVRVRDALDARLLPTPTLRLRAVTIGEKGDASRVRADRLDVEFSLSSLMRGEWRASELTLDGVALDLALDDRGRVAWPASGGSNLGALAIDRLKLNGRIALHDTASRETLAIDDIAFTGDVRALAGAARGDGEFRLGGMRYPFRLLTNRSPDNAGTHVHFAIDPGERPIGLDLDGVLSFDASVPHFDGAMTLSRAITLRGADGRAQGVTTPWKLSARVRADPAAAKFDQLDALYGTDDVGLKLSGSADIAFGASPSLRAALSARQLDADRLLARETGATEPTRLIPGLRGLVAALPPMPFAAHVAIGADSVVLGGRPLQNIAAEAHSDGDDWVLDRFDGRLPGATQLSLSGRLRPRPAHFAGALTLEASDPDLLSVWLRGEGEPALHTQKPFRLTGLLSVAPDRLALDDVDAEIDGAAVTGRLALADLAPAANASRGGVRLEAALNSETLGLDGLIGLARSFAGSRDNWPDEASVAIDLDHTRLGSEDLAPFVAHVDYGPRAVTLTKLTLGAAGGVTLDGSGAIDRAAETGRLTLTAGAPALPALTRLVAPLLPETVATRLAALPADGAAKLKLSLTLDKATDPGRANALATTEIDSPHLKASLRGSTTLPATALRQIDVDALMQSEISLDGRLSADRGQTLTRFIGLDDLVAAGDGPARAEASARGTWRAPLKFKASVSGAALDADVQGTMTPSAVAAAFGDGGAPGDPPGGSAPAATIALTARKLDLGPLFDVAPGRLPAIALASRIGLAGHDITLDDIDGTVAGARLRGHLAIARDDTSDIRGELGMDRLDLASAVAMATGALGRGLDDPLGRGLCTGSRGEVAIQTPRGILPGGIEVKPFGGKLRCDGASLSFNAKGALGGGEATADITAQSASDGLAIDARAQLSGVDGAALNWRGLTPPAGKTSLQLTLSGRGRTAGVIAGALSGGGTVSIDQAKIGGLDPAAFDKAVAVTDAGKVSSDAALRDLMMQALKGAPLSVASAQIPFSVRDGGLRVPPTTLDGDGARLVLSGGYDITADQFDLRAELTPTRIGTGTDRPSIEIFAHGPPDRLNRSTDVALLSSWLAVRAIDRETRRLESLERGGSAAAPAPPAAAPAQPESRPAATAAVPPAPAGAPPQTPALDAPPPTHEPRRVAPKPRPALPLQQPPAPPQVSAEPGMAPPLPPPIDIRPAPGTARPRPPRPPMPLTPVPPAPIPN